MELLIAHRALVNAQTVDGETAVHVAVDGYDEGDLAKVIAVLLRGGCDVNAEDKVGRTALDYAEERRWRDVWGAEKEERVEDKEMVAVVKQLEKAGGKKGSGKLKEERGTGAGSLFTD